MKRFFAVILIASLLLFGFGCAAPSQSAPSSPHMSYAEEEKSWDMGTRDMIAEAPQEMPAAPVPEAGWGETDNSVQQQSLNSLSGRKIIRNANLGIETREFDLHIAHIKARATEMGGYVENSNVQGRKPEVYGDSGRYGSLTVRIPSQSMESFLSDTRGLATVTHENSNSGDITFSYTDTESRLTVYKTQHSRILVLLEKSDKMEDIIALEAELSRLTYEIESLTTQLSRWDNLVDLATVQIEVMEIPPAMPLTTNNDDMGTRIKEGLSNTLNGTLVFFEGLLVFLISASPLLIPLAIVAVLVVLRISRKRRKAKMPAKEE